MKLDIEWFRYRELLFGRVVYMDETLREDLRVGNSDFAISSVYNPALVPNALFVRGSDRSKDKKVFSCCFTSKEEAIEVAKNIQNLLQEINGLA